MCWLFSFKMAMEVSEVTEPFDMHLTLAFSRASTNKALRFPKWIYYRSLYSEIKWFSTEGSPLPGVLQEPWQLEECR